MQRIQILVKQDLGPKKFIVWQERKTYKLTPLTKYYEVPGINSNQF